MGRLEQRFWKVISTLIGLATLGVTVLVAQLTVSGAAGSPSAKPEVAYDVGPFIDVLGGVKKLGAAIFLEDGRTTQVTNVYRSNSSIKNVGPTPILPEQIREPFSVGVTAPWAILAVKAGQWSLPLEWRRISETRFEAEPALLNPGDSAAFDVYVTHTVLESPTHADIGEIELTIDARIVNVSRLQDAGAAFEKMLTDHRAGKHRRLVGPLVVVMDTAEIAAVLALTAIYLATYLRLLAVGGFVKTVFGSRRSLVWTCGAAAASMAAAESTVDLVAGPAYAIELVDVYLSTSYASLFGLVFRPQQMINLVVLLVHFALLLMLLLRVWRIVRAEDKPL